MIPPACRDVWICHRPGGHLQAVGTDAAGRRQYLGNTPAVCRASSIDPRVFELFAQGETRAAALTRLGEHGDFGRPATQGPIGAAVLDLLDR